MLTGRTQFLYDEHHQLTLAEGPWGFESYYVDLDGNRGLMDTED